jgi:hypothetical protein
MEGVMNNNDLRGVIWSYLRKEPKEICVVCKKVCVWDNNVSDHIFVNIYQHDQTEVVCMECWNIIFPLNYLPLLISIEKKNN